MKLKLLLLITFLAPVSVFAQNDDWDWSDFDLDLGWNHKNPYMSLSYGMSDNSYLQKRVLLKANLDIHIQQQIYGDPDLRKRPGSFLEDTLITLEQLQTEMKYKQLHGNLVWKVLPGLPGQPVM